MPLRISVRARDPAKVGTVTFPIIVALDCSITLSLLQERKRERESLSGQLNQHFEIENLVNHRAAWFSQLARENQMSLRYGYLHAQLKMILYCVRKFLSYVAVRWFCTLKCGKKKTKKRLYITTFIFIAELYKFHVFYFWKACVHRLIKREFCSILGKVFRDIHKFFILSMARRRQSKTFVRIVNFIARFRNEK